MENELAKGISFIEHQIKFKQRCLSILNDELIKVESEVSNRKLDINFMEQEIIDLQTILAKVK